MNPEASRSAGEYPDPRRDTGPAPATDRLFTHPPRPPEAGAPGSWSGVDAAAVTGASGTLPRGERAEGEGRADDHRKGEITADIGRRRPTANPLACAPMRDSRPHSGSDRRSRRSPGPGFSRSARGARTHGRPLRPLFERLA